MINYHPVITHSVDMRVNTDKRVNELADRFAALNGVRPQIITREQIAKPINKYWCPVWVWDCVPSDVDYVLCMDERILPVRKLPPLPELKFAAIMDRHDRVNQGKAASKVIRMSGKYFQMHVFVAHRDTRPIFEHVQDIHDEPGYIDREFGRDGRAFFTPLNNLIQNAFEVHELDRDWNWLMTYEKQFYFDWPYMINFNANDYSTWAYLRYTKTLIERIEALGGSMEPE